MVITTGWGIVAALIWIAGLGLTQVVVDQIYHEGFYTDHVWPKILGSSVSAPVLWFVGRAMNGRSGDERRPQRARHTLFWIPIEYWGPIFVVLGVAIAFLHDHLNR